jgi:hypothetical protein
MLEKNQYFTIKQMRKPKEKIGFLYGNANFRKAIQ